MTALATIILPALLPAVADGFKGLFTGISQKLFGGTKPVGVDDQIKLMSAETEKLKAVAQLDQPVGTPSQWVIDLRASFRYVAAAVIIVGTVIMSGAYLTLTFVNPAYAELAAVVALLELFAQMSASVFSFMFGDRVYLSLKRTVAK